MKNRKNKAPACKPRWAKELWIWCGIRYGKWLALKRRAVGMLLETSGEGFIDSAVRILISIVIGSLLLAGLYTLFDDTVLPLLTERVKSLFDYKG